MGHNLGTWFTRASRGLIALMGLSSPVHPLPTQSHLEPKLGLGAVSFDPVAEWTAKLADFAQR